MAFKPDIFVTSPDSSHAIVVVEVKTQVADIERTEQDLKSYMIEMLCPFGLLVTPENLSLYRDSYTTRGTDSVRRLGVWNVEAVWAQKPPMEGTGFEAFVQDWLESLRVSARQPAGDLGRALGEYIIPALETGEIRAAHPRYR